MAELTPLYMDISGAYSGDELGLPYRDIMSEGVVGSTDLLVAQHAAGANLSVDVAAGAAWVLGDTNPAAQPVYRVRNDATVNLGIAPDPSNPRKVLIVAQATDETFAGTGRTWALQAIHGTPAASPTTPATPASAKPLALVSVAAGATSIVTANIADLRRWAIPGGSSSPMSMGPPSSPRHNELWEARDVDGNGTRWAFRYNALSSSSYKWEFVGGPPVRIAAGSLSTATTTPTGLTGGGSFTLPRGGDYCTKFGIEVAQSSGFGSPYTGISQITLGGSTTGYQAQFSMTVAGASGSVTSIATHTGATAAQVLALTVWNQTAGGTTLFTNPWFEVTPVRIA